MSASPERAGRTEMQFRELMGPGRGVIDVAALRAKLVVVERKLVAATSDVQVVSMRNDTLEAQTCELSDKVSLLEETLMRVRRSLAHREFELDASRYDLIRAGLPDTTLTVVGQHPSVHQGEWTKLRPFLAGQVVWEPGTEDCYIACDDGVRCGRRPSRSRCWERLEPGGSPPPPEPIRPDPHPVSSGLAFRQSALWVDKNNTVWSLQELSREHLLALCEWLTENAYGCWFREWKQAKVLMPCPVNAYRSASAESWMRDSPLWGAVHAEKARRRVRRSRAIAGSGAGGRMSPVLTAS